MDNLGKAVWAGLAAVVALTAASFFRSAWDDAEEDAKPSFRWFDKNRWED